LLASSTVMIFPSGSQLRWRLLTRVCRRSE
jgi:hypothetical protein